MGCCKDLITMTYYGSLLVNFGAFFLPAFYATLSKLWIANINKSQVATSDTYTYIQTIVEVLNEGLPRTAWLIIGDKTTRSIRSRLSLAYTMILFQVTMGALMTLIILVFASQFASVFVPIEQQEASLLYVRISSFAALSSSIEVSIAACTRALDRPSVPLWISSIKFAINIILDMLFISKFHVFPIEPTIKTQALIRMACDLSAALFGLFYFIYIVSKLKSSDENEVEERPKPNFNCLKVLARPAVYTFVESAIRNVIYLWLISGIIKLGSDYATAWGVFNTIRWGIVMVPVQSLEASALTFVGHNFGAFRARVGIENKKPKATNKDLLEITRPALTSTGLAFIIEIFMCILLSLWGAKSFAYYLSESEAVATITHQIWKSIDWCYIFFGIGSELGSILLATNSKWYLMQALSSNLLWMLPWAIAVTQLKMTQENALNYYSLIFGGALIVNFTSVLIVCILWALMLKKGRITFSAISHEL